MVKYRWYIGGTQKYDLMGAMQFNLLTALGLRDYHKLLDIGCGSLRAGRLFIPYLNPNCYCGIEPEKWLVEEGIKHEVGKDLIQIKSPRFLYRDDFPIEGFGEKFDFMLAHSIFTHATQEQIRKCLTGVKDYLTPASEGSRGGILVSTFLFGSEDYEGSEWVWPGKTKEKFAYYTKDFVCKVAKECGLECRIINWTHTHGQSWVIFGSAATIGSVGEDIHFNYSQDDV